MNLYPKDWLALPDGRRYQGETLENSTIPHGLGIVTLGDDHHLLFCDRYGHVFKLGLDETHNYHQWHPHGIRQTHHRNSKSIQARSPNRICLRN